MSIRLPLISVLGAFKTALAATAQNTTNARHVAPISIDGFAARLWNDPALPAPNLRKLAAVLALFFFRAFFAFDLFAIDELGAGKRASIPVAKEHIQPIPAANESACMLIDGWRHRVWSLYPVEKVRASDKLPVQQRAGGVSIQAARGEAEPFVIVLNSEVPLRNVTLSCTDLITNHAATESSAGQEAVSQRAAIRAGAVDFKRLAYVYVDEPSGTRMKAQMPYQTGVGEYPDPLLKGSGDARPHRNLQFLVTVRVPRDLSAGIYSGSLKLEYTREAWMPADKPNTELIPLEVKIRSFALPESSPLLNTSVLSPKRLPEWLQKPSLLEGIHQDFSAHFQTPDPLPSPVVRIDKDGVLTVDSQDWERSAAALFEQGKTAHLFLPVWSMFKTGEMQGLYFLWHFPAVTKQRWFGAQICQKNGEIHPDFEARFGAYLKHMHALIERRGWLDRFFVATMDEPYTYHTSDRALDTPTNNYRVIRNFVQFLRKNAPGLRTFATADPHPELNGFIDHWCLRNLDHAGEARERAEKFGELVTFCDNYRTFIDYPAVSARSFGWLAWKFGARGWLTYETLGSFTQAWEGPVFVYPQFGGSTVWGMGQMFYPDPSGPGAVAPSLRWEMMREGAEDYQYLWLLRMKLEKLPAALTQTNEAREAHRILSSGASEVVGGTGDAEIASTDRMPNAQSNRVPMALRERIGDLLETFSLWEKQ